MIPLDAALPRSGGQRIGRPAHYTIRGAPRRLAPRGTDIAPSPPPRLAPSRAPGGSNPLEFWLDQSLISPTPLLSPRAVEASALRARCQEDQHSG
jgi:hypothetical protein